MEHKNHFITPSRIVTGYFLVQHDQEWDRIPIPFASINIAKAYIDIRQEDTAYSDFCTRVQNGEGFVPVELLERFRWGMEKSQYPFGVSKCYLIEYLLPQ